MSDESRGTRPGLQRSPASWAQPRAVPPIVRDVLSAPGQPLDAATRSLMEGRFGHDFGRVAVQAGPPGDLSTTRPGDPAEREADRAAEAVTRPSGSRAAPGGGFGQVRIHTDEAAAESAQAVGALAYTVGNHVVFGSGQFRPGSAAGRRLLAHELIHTLQQGSGGLQVARQCDPTWASLAWSQRVANARAMAAGAARDQCMTDMIDEALTPNVTVHQRTNADASLDDAINANRYVEWGTLADLQVNFDRTLNAKTGNASLFGETGFRTPPGGESIRIFIVLGPRALDPVGPQHTQMALDHESEHAWKFLSQFALVGVGPPHAATPGEELEIYTEGFSRHFLDLWTIDNTANSFSISDTFEQIFSNFALAAADEQDRAFESIRMFHEVRIQGIRCNEMKFAIWLQMIQNARPANDVLVGRINALPKLGLTRGTDPATHFDSRLGCS